MSGRGTSRPLEKYVCQQAVCSSVIRRLKEIVDRLDADFDNRSIDDRFSRRNVWCVSIQMIEKFGNHSVTAHDPQNLRAFAGECRLGRLNYANKFHSSALAIDLPVPPVGMQALTELATTTTTYCANDKSNVDEPLGLIEGEGEGMD